MSFTAQNVSNSSNGTFERDFFDADGNIRIPLYAIIFLLSVMGNSLVILTLFQNRRMRTITNVFLLNLAISDLLLAVFCMPFTLIPLLLRNFIFGEFMCVAIRYLQAVSVCVNCFTLVAISAERYFAICQPLRSRTWQTLSHAYKTIIGIWMCALLLMIPIAAAQEIHPLQTGKNACREIWADKLLTLQVIYSIFLAILLLIIPLCVMSMAYGAMSYKLWFSMKQQMQDQSDSNETFLSSNNEINMASKKKRHYEGIANVSLRQTNVRSSNINRKRVIKMLFVVVFEYFVCCSPMYILNTWKIVDYKDIHPRLSDATWSLILLLFYASSFIHPVTYCFMNKNFRKAFLCVFRCFISKTKPLGRSCTELSTMNTSSLPKRSNMMNKQMSQDLA
ncbi:cholecystokinin receptor type A-like [Mytilus californianus]|uniref:cholecystokinin receptor type A-like n=1 Tax=Mytilus californianus TaxID=6549 RepID=UPI002248373F|nr:cholecystokinin receptor type A-like [Mytilus californianus]